METCLLHLQAATRCCAVCGAALCDGCVAVAVGEGWRCAAHTPGMASRPSDRERRLAAAMHGCALLNFALPLVGAAGAIVGLWWLAGASPFVAAHAREALGFQALFFALGLLVASVIVGQLWWLPLLPVGILFGVGCSLVGARRAWQGQPFRYPLTSRLVSP